MITFQYGSYVLQMRNPNIGDGDSINHHSIKRTSRGGTLINYRDTTWQKTKKFNLNFEIIKDIDEVTDFFALSAGHEVIYTDYTGETWDGYILDPQIEESYQRQCAYTCSLIFQIKGVEPCFVHTEAEDNITTEDDEDFIQEECNE